MVHYPPMAGAPLSWLVSDSASSVQASLGDEMPDTAADSVIIDAQVEQFAFVGQRFTVVSSSS